MDILTKEEVFFILSLNNNNDFINNWDLYNMYSVCDVVIKPVIKSKLCRTCNKLLSIINFCYKNYNCYVSLDCKQCVNKLYQKQRNKKGAYPQVN